MRMTRLFTLLIITTMTFNLTKAEVKIIAHRGFWKTEGSAQNSLKSLVKADSIGCYASEFDVWMTKDGELVINHDADINGLRIEDSDAKSVLKQRLANGETVPTLESYLNTAKNLSCRFVCELKVHTDPQQELDATNKMIDMIRKYGLENRTDFITFSSNTFKNLTSVAPGESGVYYLEGDLTPLQIKDLGGTGIDYNIGVLKAHPEWIGEAHDSGLLVNVWTVDKENDMKWCIEKGVDFITTNQPLLLQSLLP